MLTAKYRQNSPGVPPSARKTPTSADMGEGSHPITPKPNKKHPSGAFS